MVVVLLAATLAAAPQRSPSPGLRPLPIAGGAFEASGVVGVPGTSGVLFVDDGRDRHLFWMTLADPGVQAAKAVPVALGADVVDLEDIASDGRSYFVVGSQSKLEGVRGDGLVRFTFDPATLTTGHVEIVRGLTAFLTAHVTELGPGPRRGRAAPFLDIEGLAWDADRGRLLLGLRSPLAGVNALIVPLRMKDPAGQFAVANLIVDGPAIHLGLAGAGIRGLAYDATAHRVLVLAGPSGEIDTHGFRLLEWDGASPVAAREGVPLPRHLKAEGVARITLGGRRRTVVVFDEGQFVVF